MSVIEMAARVSHLGFIVLGLEFGGNDWGSLRFLFGVSLRLGFIKSRVSRLGFCLDLGFNWVLNGF